eukprot:CAMPEP_0172531856 /NCGR_PEP_ID=MMETSP1067-20121228/5098_1 /TAXON_ID=265564 ORGANISM="Thalassiosira punctigera, Strain Tpunct2005C2" /NCGR_SAMPLE_ID=MMETSP1067 /ASSEMBLY_ACC=CAM_ASM_000444 /LENGTH=285 /DNA_ID=CAMNT_0013316293 /DNA_START=134 /DNA_END=991 /DNA_ORIENTATION=+
MPLSSRNLSRKLGKSGKGTSSIVDKLKLQHADEFARAREEHAKKVESLENEVGRCLSEIEALKALSDECTDKFTPLPSPSKSLKFVKNTPLRKNRKGIPDKSAATMMEDLKTKHGKELARATETYAKKLQALQGEVDKFKAETEALKSSGIGNCHGEGVDSETGVAAHDKENVSLMNAPSPNAHSPAVRNRERDVVQFERRLQQSESPKIGDIGDGESMESFGKLGGQYERLFRDDYLFEEVPVIEKALDLANGAMDKDFYSKGIDKMCKDLHVFMAEIKENVSR